MPDGTGRPEDPGGTRAAPGRATGPPGLDVDVRVRRGERSFEARLAVPPGTVAAVVGPSGAGKTSILRALAGLGRPESGTIRCGDRTWFDAAARVDVRPRDRRVGVVVQELALLPHRSAWRNVAFAIDDPEDRRAAALGWLDRLGLGHRADARPADLSGGERQRVALARALARSSTALLLDEPFSALDGAAHDVAAALVRDVVRQRRIPALVITHDAADAWRLGAATYAMEDDALRVSSCVGTATATRITADEYLAQEESERWTELLDGEAVVNEPRPLHGLLATRILGELYAWTKAAPGRGLVLPPIDVRMGDRDVFAPDLCWIAEAQRPADLTALFPGIPDLCVEIRSPGTWRRDLGHERRVYEDRGTPELWLVDTQSRTVLVSRRSSAAAPAFDVELEIGAGQALTSPRLPGFVLPVDALFADVAA